MATTGQPAQVTPEQGEAELFTQVMRRFGGVYTKAQRSALSEERFYDLQNIMPLGDANLHSVPGLSAALIDFGGSNTIYAAQYGMVLSVPYIFCYSTQGNVLAFNLNTLTSAQIGTGLSGTVTRSVPFYNIYQLFIDATGYYYWNGSGSLVLITGSGVPTVGTDIAVFSGSVWVSNGRLIVISAAYNPGVIDPTAAAAWSGVNGATFLAMTDPALVGNITRLVSFNGFLYIFGSTCVWGLTDVFVPTGSIPPVPVWTLLPIQGIIGTDQPFSVFPLNRALMFASRFGVWALEGVNATKISEDLDGSWQYLNFTQGISGGQCIVLNVLNAAFVVVRQNDPILGSGTVVAMWFQGRWWYANVGNATFIVSTVYNNTPALFAFIGNMLFQMFASTANIPSTRVMTPLWDLSDPLSDKQAIRAGFDLIAESFLPNYQVSATIDTYLGSTALPVTAGVGQLVFVGSAMITFVGSGPIVWAVAAYQLYQASSPGTYSKFVGMTIQTQGLNYELDSFYIDFKKRKRW
jgi:hypothetical protein